VDTLDALAEAAGTGARAVRDANPLLFDFALKRNPRFGVHRFGDEVFRTRAFVQRTA